MKNPYGRHFIVLAALLLFSVSPKVLYAADINVPVLEMLTRGYEDAGNFVLNSRLFIDLIVQGGSKFRGSLKLNFNSGNLEKDFSASKRAVVLSDPATQAELEALAEKVNNPTGLMFKGVSASISDVFGLPITATYFIGDSDTFCSGYDFPALFGASPFTTMFSGYSYFPKGIGTDPDRFYDGIHAVSGTGAVVSSTKLAPWFGVFWYAYQDANVSTQAYSSDLRFLINTPNLKLETFMGVTYPLSVYGVYRGGLLFYYSTGLMGDFFAQVGIPYFNPAAAEFNIDQFYFLFEPRLKFDPLTVIVTLFYHPSFYRQKETGENGAIDVNFNILAGNIIKNQMQGGVETLISLRQLANTSPFSLKVLPYFSTMAGGVEWDFKAGARLFPFELSVSALEASIGVKAGF